MMSAMVRIAVLVGVCGAVVLRLCPDAGIGFLHHLLAEIHADQVVLEDVVVEHVLGGFAEVDDPLGHGGGFTPNAMFCA